MPLPRLCTFAAVIAGLAASVALSWTAARAQDPPLAAPIHDPENPDLALLQRPADALGALPLDKRGRVDWMAALRAGAIQPRAGLQASQRMEVLQLDVIMKNTREMPYVKFPHDSHTQWLACSNCHDQIFVPKAGANSINMTQIFQGKFCGVCHDRVAFTTLFACERCHSIPHGDIKAWW